MEVQLNEHFNNEPKNLPTKNTEKQNQAKEHRTKKINLGTEIKRETYKTRRKEINEELAGSRHEPDHTLVNYKGYKEEKGIEDRYTVRQRRTKILNRG